MQISSGLYIRLEHHDIKTKRHRHYTVSWEPTLWHPDEALVHRWGRVASFDRTAYNKTLAEPRGLPTSQARDNALGIIDSKQRRGYQFVRCGRMYCS